MMAECEIAPPRHNQRDRHRENQATRNLVLVASESSRGQARPTVAGPDGLCVTRVAASAVGRSAEWCLRRGRDVQVSPRFFDPIGAGPGRTADLPTNRSGIIRELERDQGPCDNREGIAAAIDALRSADVVIAGPLSEDDANAPGLLPHLVQLTNCAYRALRPPRELMIHPAFAQVARRFQYIQMNRQEARSLGAGAVDIGILAQRLRRLQGDPGEFAITAFSSHGLLWADDAWWEIDPIGDDRINEAVAESVFSMAWVVARWFRGADAARALAYARAAAAAAVRQAR